MDENDSSGMLMGVQASKQPARPPRLEIAVDHPEAALAAAEGGAERLELCASLADGGLTPSLGFVEWVLSNVSIPVHCLVRPRAGSFVYSPAELAVMAHDIAWLGEAGAQGVVLGALTERHAVDKNALQRLVELARPMRVCFHRAFDVAQDRTAALEAIIESGAELLLTSGGARSLDEGAAEIERVAHQAGGRIEIVGGAGVRFENAGRLWRTLPISTLHASLRTPWAAAALTGSTAQMGSRDGEELTTVRAEDVRALLSELAPRW